MGALSGTVAFLDRGGGSAEGLPRTTPSQEVALLSNSMAASRNVAMSKVMEPHTHTQVGLATPPAQIPD